MVLEFVDGLKSQLSDMDQKLDALSSAVGAMHADLKRLVGRPVLDIYKDWSERTLEEAGTKLQSDGASNGLKYSSLIIHDSLILIPMYRAWQCILRLKSWVLVQSGILR